MAKVEFKNVTKVYKGDVTAVKDFDLMIEDGEFIILVGPSGCGKSTMLRMLAGLETITEGEIRVDGKVVNNVAPKDRDIAMVFQTYALYPHMNIFDNMAFGLKLHKVPKKEIKARVNEVAKILEIEDLLKRMPRAVSGGQRQRVALGRAIVRNPKVFLMDEPLSNLDAKLRGQMRVEITKLHQRLKSTFVYVTHDQTEAMTMGSRIVLMKDGVCHQIDTPTNLYVRPANMFVAGFIGIPQMNFCRGVLNKVGEDYMFEIPALTDIHKTARFPLPSDIVKQHLPDYLGKEVVLGFRAESLRLNKLDKIALPCDFSATVDVIERLGSETLLYMTSDMGLPLTARIASIHCGVSQNERVLLSIDREMMHFFDPTSEEALAHPKKEIEDMKV